MRLTNGWGGRGARQRGTPLVLNRASTLAVGLQSCLPLLPTQAQDLCGGAASFGTGTNRPTWAADPSAGAVCAFDATPQYLSLGNPGKLNITGPITCSVWVAPTDFVGLNRYILGRGYDGGNEGLYFRFDAGGVKFGAYNGADHAAVWTIGGGQWDLPSSRLLVGVYTGTAWKLYANGVEMATSTDAVGPLATAQGWYVGATDILGSVQRGYLGKMWSVNIWNRALSPVEIWNLYAPQTRWDLYWTPSTRVYEFFGAAAAAGSVASRSYQVRQSVHRAATF